MTMARSIFSSTTLPVSGSDGQPTASAVAWPGLWRRWVGSAVSVWCRGVCVCVEGMGGNGVMTR